jgi:ribosomal protein L10
MTASCLRGAEIDVLARLPNREQALTMLASVLQAPVSKFGRLFTALKENRKNRLLPDFRLNHLFNKI